MVQLREEPTAYQTQWYAKAYPNGPMADPRLGSAYRLYMRLLVYADDKLTCYPSPGQLAVDLHISRQAVAKHLGVLERYGYVVAYRTSKRGASGKHGLTPTTYRLSPPDRNLAPPDAAAAGARTGNPGLPDQPSTPATQGCKGSNPRLPDPATPGCETGNPGLHKLTQVTNPSKLTQLTNPPEAAAPPESAPDAVAEVWAHFKAKIQPKARICPTKKIRARLKTFSVEDLKIGIDHLAADWWWMRRGPPSDPGCSHMGSDLVFRDDAHSERWLIMEPRAPWKTANGSSGHGSRQVSRQGYGLVEAGVQAILAGEALGPTDFALPADWEAVQAEVVRRRTAQH